MLGNGKPSVAAGSKVKTNAIMLPPCIPNKMVVQDANNEHPMAVQFSVALADNAQSLGDKNAERKVNFLLCHDFKAPTAVAVSSSSAVGAASSSGSENAAAPRLVYSKDQSESLHPFWAVRKITSEALQREKDQIAKQMKQTGEKQKMPQLNCQFVTRVHNRPSIAEVGDRPLNSTRFISVPYITNTKELAEGDELIMHHFPRVTTPAPKKSAPTWRDVHQVEV